MLGLHSCAQAFSSCCNWDHSLVAVCRLLIVVVSLGAEYGLQAIQASVVVACSHGLSTCSLQA